MQIVIDTVARTLTTADGDSRSTYDLYTKEAFEALSLQWVRVGWSLRYYHNFSWFGSPVLQLPEDLVRLQEVIFRVRPDVIVETGVFRGGSMMFHASLCEALGKGRVVGIDISIPAETRAAIEASHLAPRIQLIEGDSTSAGVVAAVRKAIAPGDKVLVILDSCHTKEHVRRELECYAPFVTPGSYIVAADGIMRDLADVPGGETQWVVDHPAAAAAEFAVAYAAFEQAQPAWAAHDGPLSANVTYCPAGWLKRLY
jgi:cephalosporin hydroxylase